MRGAWALGLLLVASVAAPASALSADPARSQVFVQVPTLAPGASGSAPLRGELSEGGSFVLRGSASQVRTGNALHDSILRQVIKSEIQLEAWSPHVKARGTRRHQGTALLRVGGATTRVPVVVRTTTRPDGVYMQTFCRVPLAPWGVRTLQGGPPGDARVAISAYFPRR